MCGILATVTRDEILRGRTQRMLEAQRMRGPDHQEWRTIDGVCHMGHNRLSLLDTSATGNQPMSADGFTITYNGEVYNHMELRARCTAYHFQGTSDTESILAHIVTYGVVETLERMNGMFAFALWDAKERTLTMATDRFGVKPMYVFCSHSVFAVASSSAALLHLKDKWEIDEEGMRQFFHLGGSARGVWQNIHRIGGGMLLTFKEGDRGWTSKRWYTPKFNPNAEAELEGLIVDAIHIASKADVPVGIFYSGGVDTSVVASVVATGFQPVSAGKMPAPLAFHLDSPERNYAEQGAAHFGLELITVNPDQQAVVPAMKDIAAKSGEPTMAGYIPWLVSRTAAEYVKACISGNGADELFFGYDRTARTPEDMPYQVNHIMRETAYTKGGSPKFDVPPLEDARFGFDAVARWYELHTYIQHDLNPTLDAASMCHSLELRVPFLDHRVVEAALSLPASFHGTKRVLKDMLRKADLPESFVERKKLGFSMPAEHPRMRLYKQEAWQMACAHFGWNEHAHLSPRDKNYLHLCAAGWRAWMEVHQHRIAA